MNFSFSVKKLVCFAGLAMTPSLLLADPFVNIQATSTVYDLSQNPNDMVDDHSAHITTSPAYLTPTKISSSQVYGSGSASCYGIGSEGVLRAYATSGYPYENVDEAATADANVIAYDDFLVTSSSLPMGTTVSVMFSFVMDGSLSRQQNQQTAATQGSAFETLNATSTIDSQSASYQAYNSGTYAIGFSLNATVGSTISFNYRLEAMTLSDAVTNENHSMTVDFSNTGILRASSSNPQVTLVSASGYQYQSVPEPTTIGLLGLGFCGLLRKRANK